MSKNHIVSVGPMAVFIQPENKLTLVGGEEVAGLGDVGGEGESLAKLRQDRLALDYSLSVHARDRDHSRAPVLQLLNH